MNFTPLIVCGSIALSALAVLLLACAHLMFVTSLEKEDYQTYLKLKGKYEKERY